MSILFIKISNEIKGLANNETQALLVPWWLAV